MSKNVPEKRIVAPYQLIFDEGNWNVRCYDYKAKDKRLFTVSEMKNFSLYDGRTNAFEIPDDFDFIGSDAYAFKMIGNAVPVEFASGIAKAVYTVLNKNEKK